MRRYSRPSGVDSLSRERDHERLHQRPQIVELPRAGKVGQHLGALALDRTVVTLGDRHE